MRNYGRARATSSENIFIAKSMYVCIITSRIGAVCFESKYMYHENMCINIVMKLRVINSLYRVTFISCSLPQHKTNISSSQI